MECELRRRVTGRLWDRNHAQNRRHIHDVPESLPAHVGQASLNTRNGPENVDLKNLSEFVEIDVANNAGNADTGVVDEQLDPPKVRDRLFDQRMDRRFVGHVGWNDQARTTKFGVDSIEPVLVACRQHHVCPSIVEGNRNRPSDAATCPSDDGNPPIDSILHAGMVTVRVPVVKQRRPAKRCICSRCVMVAPMLPIESIREAFESALDDGPVVISSPTGSGKSTQVPRWCRRRGRVLVVEPRRVACRSLATRVAELEGSPIGKRVGYIVRDDNRANAQTEIVFATPGVVLNQLADSSRALPFDVVIVDELHERRLDVDLILALLTGRSNPKLVVMSATLDGDRVATHLSGQHVRAEGRTFPVDIRYGFEAQLLPTEDRIDSRVARAVEASRKFPGDVLVFLPGKGEIRACEDRLSGGTDQILTLHGGLGLADQTRIFQRSPKRRVILSTNVAETSLTIDGVGVVIDSGLVRQTRYHGGRGFLTLVPIALDSADQRAGRAGRTAAGVVFRLWDEAAVLEAVTPPEMFRESLVPLVMAAAACGSDPATLPFLDPPKPHALDAACTELTNLGALAGPAALTERGRQMSGLPLDSHLARLLVEALDTPLLGAAIDLIAGLGAGRPLFGGHRPEEPEDDLRSAGCDAVAMIRAVRIGDPRQHGLSAPALNDIRRTARRLRQAHGLGKPSAADRMPTSREIAELALRADPRSAHVRRDRKRAVAWSNGGTEISLGRQSAVDPDKAEAIVVLDSRALGLGKRDTKIIATCAIPIKHRWMAAIGLGRERLGPVRRERGQVLATHERVYAKKVIGVRESKPTGALAREALAELITRGSMFKGAPARIDDRLVCAELFGQLITARLEDEDAEFQSLTWPAEVHGLDTRGWIIAALTELEIESTDEAIILDNDDILPPVLPDHIVEILDRKYPRQLTIGGNDYAISYAPAKRRVTLTKTRGQNKTLPPIAWLPAWQGFAVDVVDRGKTHSLRRRK
ncbi:MAG: ATP-dependent helicase HrpB [Myxococcota bacterium]